MPRLVLVGGGHAQLSVLQAFARARQANAASGAKSGAKNVDLVLVTPCSHQHYSGMLPGWIAGHYAREQCRIDLRALAQAAGARLVIDAIVGIDAERRCVTLRDGAQLAYDLLSLDVGSEIDTSTLQAAGARLLPVKPLDGFFDAWPAVMQAAVAKNRHGSSRLVVVGGGAAGVELALAVRHAWNRAAIKGRVELVASCLLTDHAGAVQRRIERCLAQAGIPVHRQRALGAEDGLVLADGTPVAADWVLAATGARAPRWLSGTTLQLDEHGYVAVDSHHRSVSHEHVYAAGDVCARLDMRMARSGVHAVHAGPVLAANLLAALTGGTMHTYTPRRRALYLLACGPRHAIASWGGFSVEGNWVWRWKDRIDRSFIARFSAQA